MFSSSPVSSACIVPLLKEVTDDLKSLRWEMKYLYHSRSNLSLVATVFLKFGVKTVRSKHLGRKQMHRRELGARMSNCRPSTLPRRRVC